MNRKNLTAAVLAGLAGVAGLAGTAQAVNLNPDGLGQVLLYPYYSANDGNITALSVVNTTENAKAVKVRFLEGFNSREVLDFNLYLSREDVWVASISMVDGVPTLEIPDTSCTVPYLYAMGGSQPFLDLAYTGAAADGGPTSIERAAEGHMEIIEMGTLVGTAAADATHDPETGMPADCMALTDRWTEVVGDPAASGIWFNESQANDGQAYTDTLRNSGGLFGGAAILNVDNGTMYSYDAKAIQGFDDTDDGIHYLPGNVFPSLNSGSQTDSWVFFGVPQNQAVMVDYDYSVDAISGVFMHDYVMNEYTTEADLNAATEWVITFPTKNFYVDPLSMIDGGIEWPTTGDCSADPDPEADACVNFARPPFTQLFGAEDADGNPLCEIVSLKTWDREENTAIPEDTPPTTVPPVVSPSLPGTCEERGDCPVDEVPFQLCYEVNVLRFGEGDIFGTPTIDGESLLVSVEDEFVDGWGRINLTNSGSTTTWVWDGDEYYVAASPLRIDEEGLVGLPVTGFAAQEYENGFLGDGSVKANYGGLFGHKNSVRAVAVPGELRPQ